MKEKIILLPVIFILFFWISFVFEKDVYASTGYENIQDYIVRNNLQMPIDTMNNINAGNFYDKYVVVKNAPLNPNIIMVFMAKNSYEEDEIIQWYSGSSYMRLGISGSAFRVEKFNLDGTYISGSISPSQCGIMNVISASWENVSAVDWSVIDWASLTVNYRGLGVLYEYQPYNPGVSVSIPLAYLQLGLRHSHPYYLYIEKPNTTIKYFAFSSKPFYVNADMYIHKAEETAGYFKYNGTSWELPVTMSGYTKILDGITPSMVTYCNHDLYVTSVENMNTSVSKVVNSSTSEIIIESKPIPGLEDEVIIYTYEYDASIENLKNLKIRKRAWVYVGNFAIGMSKDVYQVLWESPEVPGLRLEISVQSKFEDKTRRWAKQKYNRPWDGEFYIMPEDEKMEISMMALGKAILSNEWNDVDTGSWYSIPPTELYFRYVIIDSGQQKVKYGNWTRLDFRSGSNGIVETAKDVVTSNETVDPDTGEVVYEDVPIEGNETEYIGEAGGEVDESQSFNTAVDTLDNALNSSITGLQSVGTWLGQVPELIGKLFTFLPPEYLLIIGLGITMCIILMIAGR